MAEGDFIGIFIACGCVVGPWLLSLVATMIYQPRKRKVLLERESAAAVTGDALTTLSKPFGNREIREFRVMMANVVMSPSWVQMWIGGIMSIFGGQINVYTKVVDWARREAKQRLREQVSEAGFDEVINLRIETTMMTKTKGGKDRTSGVEILVYGTAIKY
ncbi:MAG: heavy metal-binding domain-containing protein [Candidatus Poseidoniales archaeon]|nr:heavy metal-binding domain-containing protein [Candidatus Poseidoniales archaeon]